MAGRCQHSRKYLQYQSSDLGKRLLFYLYYMGTILKWGRLQVRICMSLLALIHTDSACTIIISNYYCTDGWQGKPNFFHMADYNNIIVIMITKGYQDKLKLHGSVERVAKCVMMEPSMESKNMLLTLWLVKCIIFQCHLRVQLVPHGEMSLMCL